MIKPYYHDDRERNEDKVRFARSLCVRKRLIAFWLPGMSLPQFLRL